jgi:hypothetical protein
MPRMEYYHRSLGQNNINVKFDVVSRHDDACMYKQGLSFYLEYEQIYMQYMLEYICHWYAHLSGK